MVTELKNSNCFKTKKKSIYDKTQLVTKLKFWQNSKCDKTQVVTKPKLWQNSNCEKKKKEKKNQMWQNSDCDSSDSLKVVTKKTFLQNKTLK